jgi:hypothetical protein
LKDKSVIYKSLLGFIAGVLVVVIVLIITFIILYNRNS